MKRLVDAYDARGNSAAAWWWCGKNLFFAADVLRERWVADLDALPLERQAAVTRTSLAVHGPMLMLRACAMECLLKALCLDNGHRLAERGTYKSPTKRSHSLIQLAKLTRLALDTQEEALLAKLELWVTAGRYPIETSWQATYPAPRPVDDPTLSWSPTDERALAGLRDRLAQEDARLSTQDE